MRTCIISRSILCPTTGFLDDTSRSITCRNPIALLSCKWQVICGNASCMPPPTPTPSLSPTFKGTWAAQLCACERMSVYTRVNVYLNEASVNSRKREHLLCVHAEASCAAKGRDACACVSVWSACGQHISIQHPYDTNACESHQCSHTHSLNHPLTHSLTDPLTH